MAKNQVNFKHLYNRFSASLSRHDCGQFCAPLNHGDGPVCCDIDHAIPVMEKEEFKVLQSRSDLWRRYFPKDKVGKEILKDLPKSCIGAVCKGARFCERDNRSIACRAFPFYPYMDKEGTILGLATYWIFEDRCWVISNMAAVEKAFVAEFLDAYTYMIERDESEKESFRWQSLTHRRVFSRWNRPIFLIGKEGGYLKILPKGKGVEKATIADLPRHGPYKSQAAYRKALQKAKVQFDPALLEKVIPY